MWLDKINSVVETINAYTADYILVVLLVAVGLFFTVRTRFVQVRCFGEGMKRMFGGFSLRGGKQSGGLSSFLDNAPTAVAFYTVATGLPITEGAAVAAGISDSLLTAIALGSVLFGALTYIGNGPNFMVKAIAENDGVRMPSFFGYIFKFSLIVLLPTYILMALIFF